MRPRQLAILPGLAVRQEFLPLVSAAVISRGPYGEGDRLTGNGLYARRLLYDGKFIGNYGDFYFLHPPAPVTKAGRNGNGTWRNRL